MSEHQAGPGRVESYHEAVAFLEQGLDYEKIRRWQYDRQWLKLDRMRRLLEALDRPEERYRIVHVAGTKGKGSTAGLIARLLTRHGLRTGLLTSPHLVSPRERIRVDGRQISEEQFRRGVRRMQPHVKARRRAEEQGDHKAPTYFEMLTALGFDHFARRGADWAVVEVGLGGRLDCTNVVEPDCCVITVIGLEHTEKLGDTPAAIAGEKAGIIKEGVPVMLGRQQHPEALEVLRSAAEERHCPRWEVGREVRITDRLPLAAPLSAPDSDVGWRFGLRTPDHEYADLHTPLLGAHQLDNLGGGIGTLHLLQRHRRVELDPGRVAAACREFTLPGRVQLLQRNPAVILDVAHTVESIGALLEALDTHFPGRRLHAVVGFSADKNVRGMLGVLAGRCASLTAVQAQARRAMPAEKVAEIARDTEPQPPGGIRRIADPWTGLRQTLAEAEPDEIVCVTGSFYVAGEVHAGWLAERGEPGA